MKLKKKKKKKKEKEKRINPSYYCNSTSIEDQAKEPN